ncbi:hypothetical protein FGO68_gene2911 [Halteria grandinella]|uniref:Uncharacterized protein n=1 Tax=Halteria grandinella TaxID=5974 RepID=A0A8J8T4R7_HALGN|nr:hypothetical protein FGO68_gene2911 [Halteria grandinella]
MTSPCLMVAHHQLHHLNKKTAKQKILLIVIARYRKLDNQRPLNSHNKAHLQALLHKIVTKITNLKFESSSKINCQKLSKEKKSQKSTRSLSQKPKKVLHTAETSNKFLKMKLSITFPKH